MLCEAHTGLIRSSYGCMRLNARLIRVLYGARHVTYERSFPTDTMPPLRRKKKAAPAGVAKSPPSKGKTKGKQPVDEGPTQETSSERDKEPSDDVPPPEENDNSSSGVPLPDVQVAPVVEASSPPSSPSPPPPDPDTEFLQPCEDTLSKYLFTEAQESDLAEFYREHEIFYNKKVNAYKDAAKKRRLMEEKAASMTPPCTCKYFL